MSDIRTALTEAFSSANKTESTFDATDVDTAPVVETTEPAAEVVADSTESVESRSRDEKGRFAQKTVKDNVAQAKEQASVAPVKQGQPVEQAAPENKRKPPSAWKPELASKFETLPPEFQDEILRREGDFHKGFHQLRQSVQQAEAINREVQPYMATIRALGATAPQAIGHLLNLDHQLRHGTQDQKLGVVRHVMQAAGLNPDEYFGEKQQINPELQPILQELNQVKSAYQEMQEAANRREMQEVNSTLSGFSTDKPHFELVRNRMADLIEIAANHGETLSLDDAYDRAIWENPEIRQSLIAERETAAEQRARQAAQAARAKTASASVNGAPNGTPSNAVKPKSVREALQQAVAAHRA